MRVVCLLLVCCVSIAGALAQTHGSTTNDTAAFRLFLQARTDTDRVKACRALVMANSVQDQSELPRWSDSLLKYAERANDTSAMRLAFGGHIAAAIDAGSPHTVIRFAERAITIAKAQHNNGVIFSNLGFIARSWMELGELDRAWSSLIEAVHLFELEQVDSARAGQLFMDLGGVYLLTEEPELAIGAFQTSMDLFKPRPMGRIPAFQPLVGIASAHRMSGRTGLALEWMEKARPYLLTSEAKAEAGAEEALILLQLGKRDEALRLLRVCMELVDTVDAPAARAKVQRTLGALLPPPEAIPLLREATDFAQENHMRRDLVTCLRLLSGSLSAIGGHREAAELAHAALLHFDTLSEDRRNRAVQRMKVEYETELKDKAIASLQQEKELEKARAAEQEARIARQRQLIIGASVIGALLLLTSVFAYRAFRLKRRSAAELEQKNAEVLQQKERAEESERAKDRFLANVSHEVRTPLNAIMGFTGLLLHEAKDERQSRFLGNIRDAGDNLLVVINDVLDLSRIEAGRLHLVKEPFDLHRCLRLCAEMLQHRATEQRDELLLAIDTGTPQWINGDSARLTQIVLNLAGNALKFTTNGTVRIDAKADAERLVVSVKDTGIGIPEDKLATVFDRFTQVNDTDQRRYGGTGLGLSIVKELVQLHKGTIAVESQPGQGTCFTVKLPLVPAEVPETGPAVHRTAPSASLTGRTVLLAEDNDMNALVTEETLVRSYPKVKVERVTDGHDVVERMRSGSDVALILMDVQMPKLDGIAATRAIRAMDAPAGQVPIIALTASVLPNDLSRCIDAGMDACVPKPFKAPELLTAIERLTGEKPGALPKEPGGDMLLALFKRMVPERLKALKEARVRDDREKMQRVVHSLRPQLVHHDSVRFGALCDGLLALPKDAADWDARFTEFTHAVEQALAKLS